MADRASKSSLSADIPVIAEDAQSEMLTAALNNRLRWKTDLVVLPLIVLTSTLAFLDKVTLPFNTIPPQEASRLMSSRMAWPTQQFTA